MSLCRIFLERKSFNLADFWVFSDRLRIERWAFCLVTLREAPLQESCYTGFGSNEVPWIWGFADNLLWEMHQRILKVPQTLSFHIIWRYLNIFSLVYSRHIISRDDILSDLHQGLDIDYSGLPKSVEQILGSHLWCTVHQNIDGNSISWRKTPQREILRCRHTIGDTEINILQGKSFTLVIDPAA